MAAHFPPSPALRTSLHWNLLVCTRCIAPGAMQNCVHLPPVPPRIQKYCIRSAANALWYRHSPIEKRHPVNQRTGICHGREFGASIIPPTITPRQSCSHPESTVVPVVLGKSVRTALVQYCCRSSNHHAQTVSDTIQG